MFEDGLFAWLNQRPELQALAFSTGSFFDGTNCRIFPVTIAEDAVLPALGYARVGGAGSGLTMSGSDGLTRARIQFTAVASTAKDAATLLGVLIGIPGAPGILNTFKGTFPNGVVIQLTRPMMDPIDTYVAEARLYARHVDIEFIYET